MGGLLILLFLIVFFVWLCSFLQPSKRLKELGAMFPGPETYPILGNMPAVGTNSKHLSHILWKMADQYGSTFRLFLGRDLYVFLSKPEDIAVVLAETKHNKSKNTIAVIKPLLGEGLSTAPEAKWKVNRKRLLPAFHMKILENFIPVFEINSKILVEKLSSFAGGPEIDITQLCATFSLRNICETAMGVSLDYLSTNNLYHKTIDELTAIMVIKIFVPLLTNKFIYNLHPLGRKEQKLLNYVDSITEKVIRSRKEEHRRCNMMETHDKNLTVGQTKRLIFLDLLLNIQKEDHTFSDQQIRDEVNTFLFAGHHTVAATIPFCLYVLSKNIEIQDKIYEETEKILGRIDRPFELKDVQEMRYLEQVIKETLRLYTIIPMTSREAASDITLESGLVIPAGAEVMLWFHRMHHDPELYPNPEIFNPDNFSSEKVNKRKPHSFLPFGGGKRDCIGMKFAFLELKTVLSYLVQNFIFLPSDSQEDLYLITELNLKSESGIHVKIQRRRK